MRSLIVAFCFSICIGQSLQYELSSEGLKGSLLNSVWEKIEEEIIGKNGLKAKLGQALPELPDPFVIEFLPVNISCCGLPLVNGFGNFTDVRVTGLSSIKEHSIYDPVSGRFTLNYHSQRDLAIRGFYNLDVTFPLDFEERVVHHNEQFSAVLREPTMFISGKLGYNSALDKYLVTETHHNPFTRDSNFEAFDLGGRPINEYYVTMIDNLLSSWLWIYEGAYYQDRMFQIKAQIEEWIEDGKLFPELKK